VNTAANKLSGRSATSGMGLAAAGMAIAAVTGGHHYGGHDGGHDGGHMDGSNAGGVGGEVDGHGVGAASNDGGDPGGLPGDAGTGVQHALGGDASGFDLNTAPSGGVYLNNIPADGMHYAPASDMSNGYAGGATSTSIPDMSNGGHAGSDQSPLTQYGLSPQLQQSLQDTTSMQQQYYTKVQLPQTGWPSNPAMLNIG
jgi:hypothetical protein